MAAEESKTKVPASQSKPKLVAVKNEPKPLSKAEELIPFDEDLDRTKLAKAEDF